MRQADWPRAVARLGESLAIRREIGDRGGSAWCLERLAEIAVAQGQPEKGARLFGAAAALRESIGSAIDPVDQPEYEKNLAALRAQLSPEQFASAWAEGRALTMNKAIEYGLDQANLEE